MEEAATSLENYGTTESWAQLGSVTVRGQKYSTGLGIGTHSFNPRKREKKGGGSGGNNTSLSQRGLGRFWCRVT